MIDDVKRLAGPFTGAGQSTFPFSFRIFAPTDIRVELAQEDGVVPSTLSYGVDYTVVMNQDQGGTPGGFVTLTSALVGHQVVAISSCVPYTQELNLTNFSRFAPESINTELDREVAQIQQLAERVSRAISVDATDAMTPQELKSKLLSAADTAANVAKSYADAAKASADSAKASEALVLNAQNTVISEVYRAGAEQRSIVIAEGNTQHDRVIAATDAQLGRVTAEGDTQIARIARAGDAALEHNGLHCLGGTKIITLDLAYGAIVDLPVGVSYVVSFNHLRVCLNGVVLYPVQQYEEVGAESTESSQIKMLMPLMAGDSLWAWVVPVGGVKDPDTGVVTPDEGTKCQQATWAVTVAQAAGSVVTLPVGMSYIAQKRHLVISWNGIVLAPYTDYNEVGLTNSTQTTFTINFDLRVGDVLNAWTVPYDRGQASETKARLDALQAQVVELSQKVVYKNEQAAS